MERSLVLVKPDAVERGLSGTIISRLENTKVTLIALKMLHMDQALAERHYAPHKERSFFNDLIKFITSGPIVAAVFEGDNAVSTIRTAMGATDPAKAAAGSIRHDFGLDIEHNAVHGSDSVQTAEHEIRLFFTEAELMRYTRKQ
ncbi:MAG: nucleoside-diphosphate kinase [Dehalococcoidia bacterium]|nr:nucleoside-diphosphate kinase [Dehalococcoidia bacterium]